MFYPVEAFEDGGILLALQLSARLFYFSNETKAIREIKKESNYTDSNLILHSPYCFTQILSDGKYEG